MGVAQAQRASLASDMQRLWTRLKTLVNRGVSHADVMDLEQVLLEADFGPQATFDLIDRFESRRKRADFGSDEQFRAALIDDIASMVTPPTPPSSFAETTDGGPAVVLILGVNGTGKTTSAAKIAHRLGAEGRSVQLVAADTFRAAAVEQLRIWADRLDIPCVTGAPGGDPAAVAFDAIEAAEHRGVDVVIVDTAGRLHTQGTLMEELRKVVRVVGKRRPGAPHETLLVLDGTTGQNMLAQARAFSTAVPVSALVVTKLDGTAKGGAVVALARELELFPRFIGTGETLEDLVMFDPRAFASTLVSE